MAREPVIYTLSQPAQAHGEDITTLTLRPARGEDVAACGFPFTVTNMMEMERAPDTTMPDVTFHGPALIAVIARLADVPRSTVTRLPASDIWNLSWVVFGLFLDTTPKTSSGSASTSPGSGNNLPAPSSP